MDVTYKMSTWQYCDIISNANLEENIIMFLVVQQEDLERIYDLSCVDDVWYAACGDQQDLVSAWIISAERVSSSTLAICCMQEQENPTFAKCPSHIMRLLSEPSELYANSRQIANSQKWRAAALHELTGHIFDKADL